MAINSSASGPVLRASGVKWDIRKADPYSIYDRFDFDVPTGSNGDCYDRYLIRMEEIRQSIRILEQASSSIPEGKYINPTPVKIGRRPVSLRFILNSNNGNWASIYLGRYRQALPLHIRPPSLHQLTATETSSRREVADSIIIFGSIDICLGG
jgi:NADH-quinone oxidoreductase subunit D